MKPDATKSRYWVPMLGHAFRALEAFYEAGGELSLQEVSSRANVTKSSAYRILFTLEHLNYLEKDAVSGKYSLGLKFLEAAGRVRSGRSFIQIARPYMEKLRDRHAETINLAALQNGEIVYVEILESSHSFRMTGDVGSRAPFHASALGKCIAAFIPEAELEAWLEEKPLTRFTSNTITQRGELFKALTKIRQRGYCLDDEEIELGASCLAVPILNRDRLAVSALSVAGPTPRIRAKQKAITQDLKRIAIAISQQMQL